MRYPNLKALCAASASTRRYFLSLPVDIQTQVSAWGEWVHSAAELREYVRAAERMERK